MRPSSGRMPRRLRPRSRIRPACKLPSSGSARTAAAVTRPIAGKTPDERAEGSEENQSPLIGGSRREIAMRYPKAPWLLSILAMGLLTSVSAWHRAPTEVDLALVLAVDVSTSMDPDEQDLQRQGYVEAFRSPMVHQAIHKGMLGRIAVTYVEWAGAHPALPECRRALDRLWKTPRTASPSRTGWPVHPLPHGRHLHLGSHRVQPVPLLLRPFPGRATGDRHLRRWLEQPRALWSRRLATRRLRGVLPSTAFPSRSGNLIDGRMRPWTPITAIA